MKKKEIEEQMKMTYIELANYLLEKYGKVPYNYFCNESCKTKKHKNSRINEGLFIHHIDEDKAILLSNPRHALRNPYSYQLAERLVYCNYIEHFLLHIKISEEPKHPNANEFELPGIGGAIGYIIPELNDFYMGVKTEQKWRNIAYDIVKENYKEYILLLKYFYNLIINDEKLKKRYSIDNFCYGFERKPYSKIKESLS